MKEYHGITAAPGYAVGKISRIIRNPVSVNHIQFSPEKELELLNKAISVAQAELERLSARTTDEEGAIFMFQSMILEDDSFCKEIYATISSGTRAALAVEQVGQRYAEKLRNMTDNPYLQLRCADVMDACQRVTNILDDRPRERLVLDHPVIIAADTLLPSDLFSAPSGMILGIVTAEGGIQSHAAIIARAMNIPAIVQVGRDFLQDCDGRSASLDAEAGLCILDPDTDTRQSIIARICEHQRKDEDLNPLRAYPNRTKDGTPFELFANCFGPEDIDSAVQNGAFGVGLLRSTYLMMPGHSTDEQEQYFFYTACLAAAQGMQVTVRTFDLGGDRALEDIHTRETYSHLGVRGIRYSLLWPRQLENQICALLRAGLRGPLRVMFPMVTTVEDWDGAMRIVERCRQNLRARGVAFDEDMQFGIMLSIPAACLTAEDFAAHGCDFFCIGTNDLIQYTHAADRNLSEVAQYYIPTGKAMQRLIRMVLEAGKAAGIPVSICGLAVGNPVNAVEYLKMGLRIFSTSPHNILKVKQMLLKADLSETTQETK